MIKALLFDCGGVLVAPTLGDWALCPEYETILGATLEGKQLAAFRAAYRAHIAMLPDVQKINTESEEVTCYLDFFRAVFSCIGMDLTQAQLEAYAHRQTYRADRFSLFCDVAPYLAKWKPQYRLGIVSDAPPSTRRIMVDTGVMAFMSGATFSCDLGIVKPDRRIFESTLSQLKVQPQEAVFLDDSPEKLQGALDMGMPAVQMRRPMPLPYEMPPQWSKGPVVRSLEAFDQWLSTLGS